MYVDPGVVEFYFWVHIVLLFIVGGVWLYSWEETDDSPAPKDEDELLY